MGAEVGATLKGWTLEARLGSGGQATTWRGRDAQGREAAVKVFSLSLAGGWKPVELFEREARVLRSLDHPAIPRFIDAFTVEQDHGTDFVIVQELIEGESLAAAMTRGRRWDQDELVALARELLAVLGWLHARVPPVIHRDLKPSNVIRRPKGGTALIDFGAVQEKLHARPEGGSTVVGTHGYMAPEQLMGRAEPASDLYALGATLVHLASGHHPAELPARGLHLDFRPVTRLPDGLLGWLEALLDPDPRQRPPSAEAALTALEDALVPRALAPTTPATPPARRPSHEPQPQGTKLLGVVAGGAVAVGVGLIAFMTVPQEAPSDPHAAPPQAVEIATQQPPPPAHPGDSEVFVDLPVEVEVPEGITFEPRVAVVRRAEPGFPVSSLDVGGTLKNGRGEPLERVRAVVITRSFQKETRLRWEMVSRTSPVLDPDAARFISSNFYKVPDDAERIKVVITEIAAPESEPPPATPTPIPVEGGPPLPEGVTLSLVQTRSWEGQGSGRHRFFDHDLQITGLDKLQWLELRPSCLDPQGNARRSQNDRDFQIIPTVLHRQLRKDGDTFSFRVFCPTDAQAVRWSVSTVKAAVGKGR